MPIFQPMQALSLDGAYKIAKFLKHLPPPRLLPPTNQYYANFALLLPSIEQLSAQLPPDKTKPGTPVLALKYYGIDYL
jgi:hypothetical protein